MAKFSLTADGVAIEGVVTRRDLEAVDMLHEATPEDLGGLAAGWRSYRKTSPTRAIRIRGPFRVATSESENEPFLCEDGWLAVDARGYPYAIADDEFQRIYEETHPHPGTEAEVHNYHVAVICNLPRERAGDMAARFLGQDTPDLLRDPLFSEGGVGEVNLQLDWPARGPSAGAVVAAALGIFERALGDRAPGSVTAKAELLGSGYPFDHGALVLG